MFLLASISSAIIVLCIFGLALWTILPAILLRYVLKLPDDPRMWEWLVVYPQHHRIRTELVEPYYRKLIAASGGRYSPTHLWLESRLFGQFEKSVRAPVTAPKYGKWRFVPLRFTLKTIAKRAMIVLLISIPSIAILADFWFSGQHSVPGIANIDMCQYALALDTAYQTPASKISIEALQSLRDRVVPTSSQLLTLSEFPSNVATLHTWMWVILVLILGWAALFWFRRSTLDPKWHLWGLASVTLATLWPLLLSPVFVVHDLAADCTVYEAPFESIRLPLPILAPQSAVLIGSPKDASIRIISSDKFVSVHSLVSDCLQQEQSQNP